MEVGDWKEKLLDIPKKEYFQNLINFLNLQAREKKTIYPPRVQSFRAFELTHSTAVKVSEFNSPKPLPSGLVNSLFFSGLQVTNVASIFEVFFFRDV